MGERLTTRLAPTPSGYLHLGNAWCFTLAWLLARSRGGAVHLRIDDLDAARLRREYLEDIFASLAWLGLDWDSGPRSPEDFLARHSQRLRFDRYREALERLAGLREEGRPLLYACDCSRERIRRDAEASGRPGLYPGTCRDRGLPLDAPGTALRMRLPEGETVAADDLVAGRLRLEPGRESGDVVLRQRNGDPAYQLASVVDDEDLGIRAVVRGMDLLPSTGIQLALAGRLGAGGFLSAAFLHHGLIVDAAGGKLSKSTLSSGEDGAAGVSLRAIRRRFAEPREIHRFFATLLGLDAAAVNGPRDLLAGFQPSRIPAGPIGLPVLLF